MKACFLIAECSLSYAKIVQTSHTTKTCAPFYVLQTFFDTTSAH